MLPSIIVFTLILHNQRAEKLNSGNLAALPVSKVSSCQKAGILVLPNENENGLITKNDACGKN